MSLSTKDLKILQWLKDNPSADGNTPNIGWWAKEVGEGVNPSTKNGNAYARPSLQWLVKIRLVISRGGHNPAYLITPEGIKHLESTI